MALPALPFTIPEVQLPFDISVLMHPVVVHFVIAIPIVVLLLEIINIFVKKRTIGVVSFFLLALVTVASAAAYLTGSIDGKEVYSLLNEAGQSELKSHKILGIYLMLASAIVLLFKLLSSMIRRGLMKGLYLLVLVFFIFGILKQGKEGSELVYKYGANVEAVKILDDKTFNIKEELEELKEKYKSLEIKLKESTTKKVEVVEETKEATPEPTQQNVEVVEETKEATPEPTQQNVEVVEETKEATPEPTQQNVEVVEETKEATPEPTQQNVEVVEETKEATPEPTQQNVEVVEETKEATPHTVEVIEDNNTVK